MAPKYSKKASAKIARVMREFERGTLKSSSGRKVTSRKQAIAIGISEARARGYKVPPERHHSTRPTQADIDREAARAAAAKPSAWVTAYPMDRYVDEAHINVTTTIGDLAGSHYAAYAALKKAGVTPARSSAGTIRLTVEEGLPLSKVKALVIATLEDAGIKAHK